MSLRVYGSCNEETSFAHPGVHHPLVIFQNSSQFLKFSTGKLSQNEVKSPFSEALNGLLENNLPSGGLGSVEKREGVLTILW